MQARIVECALWLAAMAVVALDLLGSVSSCHYSACLRSQDTAESHET